MTENRKNLSVSVVMCTYNGAAYVKEQLQSIVQQTYPIKEILVFDDGSTDATVDIINGFAATHNNIKLFVNEKNVGYTRNFEKGFLQAEGDVIAPSDQDDIWVHNKLEIMMNSWKPGISLIYCHSYMFKEELPTHELYISKLVRWYEGTNPLKIFLYNTVSGHAMIFKKELLQKALPFSENITYDWWMAIIASYNGGVQVVPQFLVFHRIHDANATAFDPDKATKREEIQRFKKIMIRSNRALAASPIIPEKHRKFAAQIARLFEESLDQPFHKPLLFFLIRHRTVLFNYRKRLIPIFTQVKQSFRITRNE